MASKIVVVGSVNGKYREMFEKLSGLQKKNSFVAAFVAGDLFGELSEDDADLEDLLQGRLTVPLPTYFVLGHSPLPPKVIEKLGANNGELCENLYYLGKRTTIKTSEGIKVVALGGVLDPELTAPSSKDSYTPFYSTGDASSLRGANSADILLTSEWPESIRSGSKVDTATSPRNKPAVSHKCISELCAALKPRYHFSVSDTFFEREPFFHPPHEQAEDQGYSITRFISLAPFGNAQKQKWIYAFSIDLSAAAPLVVPAGTTASPLNFASKKRALPAQGAAFSRFSQDDNPHRHKERRHNKKTRQPPPGPSECFFCLSNPDIPTHLITSIGTEAYLTTAKGPLPETDTFPALQFPCHIQIIPLAHSPTLSLIPDPQTRESTIQEMTRYRTALHKMLQQISSSSAAEAPAPALGSITWEVNRSTGIHALWQFLPISADLITRGLATAAFQVEAENSKYPPFETATNKPFSPQPAAGAGAGDSFNVWLWAPDDEQLDESSGGRETQLVLPLDSGFRFDLQFGRRVLAKLLGLEKRMNWRECEQSVADETRDAEAFKGAFKDFDFTLEE